MSAITPAAESARIPESHVRVAFGALIAAMAWSTTVTGFSFFTNPILQEFPEWGISTFTIYFTLYSLASAFSMPLAANLLTKLGARWLLAIGGLVAGLGQVIFAMSSQLWMFYLGGLIAGVGVGISAQYVPIVLVNRWFVEKRGLVMGLVLAGTGMGGVLLALVIPQAMAALGWRGAMVILALIMVTFTMVPALFLVRTDPSEIGSRAYGADDSLVSEISTGNEKGLSQKQALATPWLYILFASILIMGVTHAMNQHVVNYLALRPYGIEVPAQRISFAIIVATISLIIYKPLLGALVDRFGLIRTFTITLAIAALATFVSAFTTTWWVYVVCVAGFSLGFANGTVMPPLITERAFGPRDFSKLWGLLGMAYPIGAAVGTPLWGMVKDQTGTYGWGFISVPIVTAIFVLGYILCITRARRQWVPVDPELDPEPDPEQARNLPGSSAAPTAGSAPTP